MKKIASKMTLMLIVVVMMAVSGIGEFVVKAEGIEQESLTLEVENEEKGDTITDELLEIEQFEDDESEDTIIKQEQIIDVVDIKEELNLYVSDEFQVEIIQTGDGILTYESNDPEIIVIDETGLLKAVKEGETEIVIRASETENYLAAELRIPVKVIKKEQNLKYQNMEFVFGEEAKKVVFDNPLNSAPVFKMENSKIAKVDDKGNVTPLKVGETYLHILIAGNDIYKDTELLVKVVVKTTLTTPKLIKIVGADGNIKIYWEKVKDADGYYIYEKVGSKYKRIATIDNPEVLEYTRENVSDTTKYYYYVKAFSDIQGYVTGKSNTRTGRYLLAPDFDIKEKQSAVDLKWSEVTGAEGYYIYRREKSSGSYKKVASITSPTTLAWTDKSPTNGKKIYYYVMAYYSDSRGNKSSSESVYYLKSPSINSAVKKSKSTKMTVKWSRNKSASGYQVQYANNSFFYKPRTITIKKNSTLSKTISKLIKDRKYYVRVRAYKTVNGKKYYSDWSLSSNVKSTKTLSSTVLKYKKKTFELKSKAKQKLGAYDTVQGGCTDGKYAYYVLYNRKVENCKVVKVNLTNMKVTKVSKVLNISHGNDMTYNSKTKKLIVTHTNINTKRISIINPSTLKMEKTFDVTIPTKMTGVSDKELKQMKGFAAIAYNAKKKQYVTLLKGTGDIMILNSKFVPISYIKLSKKSALTKQGIDVTDDYILISYSGYPNIIMVYTWTGQYVSKINVKKGYEIENVYHIGKQYYATFYASEYKNGKLSKRDNYVYKLQGL